MMADFGFAARKSLPRVDQDPFCDVLQVGHMCVFCSYLTMLNCDFEIIVHTDPACTFVAQI